MIGGIFGVFYSLFQKSEQLIEGFVGQSLPRYQMVAVDIHHQTHILLRMVGRLSTSLQSFGKAFDDSLLLLFSHDVRTWVSGQPEASQSVKIWFVFIGHNKAVWNGVAGDLRNGKRPPPNEAVFYADVS